MIKVLRTSKTLEMGILSGVDAASDGLARARKLGVATTAGGIDGLLQMLEFRDVQVVFDATSAKAHARHDRLLRSRGVPRIDLTPAAMGRYVVPVINLREHSGSPNLNMVSWAGKPRFQSLLPCPAWLRRITPRSWQNRDHSAVRPRCSGD